ncbi:hypothetical protein [Flavobacterium algoritolerans]|uniref:Uncharacterized protein n=2 Tax=Flavobacterium TaxID=237 RepID=A0ABT6V845_9FLAO|nr:hypothetical protein [Flavobacterium algoritolerans]MDI5894398.1 hypothetical protein [Flavobacterium algoritolerans]
MNSIQELRDECKRLGITYQTTATQKQLQVKIKTRIMKDNTKDGIISKEQIEAWKKQYKVEKLPTLNIVVAPGDVAIGYLRPPSRNHKATALSMYSQNKVLECGEFLRDNCWLGGDSRLQTDENIADSAAIQASGIVKFLSGELGEV